MTKKTLLSIIVPTFNRQFASERILEYCRVLHLALEGTTVQFEMIVIDDGSKEDICAETKRKLKKMSAIKFYESHQNKGPGVARDYGLQFSSGKWVWFLDDDDELDPRGLKTLVDALSSEFRKEDVIAHSLQNDYSYHAGELAEKIIEKLLYFREKQEVFNYIFRREFLLSNEIKFSEGFHEDIRYLYQVFSEMSGFHILPRRVVLKRNSEEAITSKMTSARIDGYFRAFLEIIDYASSNRKKLRTPLDVDELFSQTLGVILHCTMQENNQVAAYLLSYLGEKVSLDLELSRHSKECRKYGVNSTNFKYASSFWRTNIKAEQSLLINGLRKIFDTRLSCKDLDSSLFLGPDEIRACCKRFFVAGKRKGDVVLLRGGDEVNLKAINEAKADLIRRINVEGAEECEGCPYIERREIGSDAVDYISLENFSYCNMRCTYCSPKYYGGTEASYNAAKVIEELTNKCGGLSQDCHVVWGGGEPTLSPRFKPVNEHLISTNAVTKVRVLSNSLKHSDQLHSLIADKRVHLVTSIDAGTPLVFREIRGKGDITKVIENLQAYSTTMKEKRRLTIKYILMPNNASSSELESFVLLMLEAGLMESMFQISCDFTLESAPSLLVCAMYELAARLCTAGADIVFFDDLIRDRVKLADLNINLVREHLQKNSVNQKFIHFPSPGKKIVLWGRGLQARWLSGSTNCGHSGLIIDTVSDEAQYFHKRASEGLSDLLIYPSGVQSIYEIIKNIEDAKLGDRLLRGVLI